MPDIRGETLTARIDGGVCRLCFTRPEAGNTITAALVTEMDAALRRCEDPASGVSVVVLEGAPDVFCTGGDFEGIADDAPSNDPEPLYDLWQRLAEGPFVSVAVVRGRANAGGVGFVAACDLVLAEPSASFSLSELLFGLYPACVLPFLVRRVGRQTAHVMTLTTQPMGAAEALRAGLVDALDEAAEPLLRRHLVRLRRLARPAVARYKQYTAEMDGAWLAARRPAALAANREMFADPAVRAGIRRYVREMKFPWED
ncbi:enoyl-CoA hydratase/isomerase [Roseospira navarrensis]|uniref:Enoyl-CoA hydratase/isomerase n=1 Tax=Roseospira navarrensis TaxID=140058 RepID=A0A7X1ZCA9_9PROT|nr:enoyl-CoA hydratase/isomerase [Roseospira navarrensis]MQX35688.1 enoyl-CoA hydratase/isomerase [Roseospira navarrensis]